MSRRSQERRRLFLMRREEQDRKYSIFLWWRTYVQCLSSGDLLLRSRSPRMDCVSHAVHGYVHTPRVQIV